MKPTAIEMARKGQFAKEYTTKNFLSVRDALSIDRVVFEGVPIGQQGKNGATVWLPVDKMLALCLDIKSGVAKQKIDADNGPYPTAYQYVTGDKGSRVLTIGGGKFGCRVSVQNKAESKTQTVALAYSVLEEMADRFLLWTGRIPVVADSFYGKQVEAFNQGMAERVNNRPAASDEELGEPEAQDEPAEAPVAAAPAPAPATPGNGVVDEYRMIVYGDKKSIKDSSGAPCWVFDAKYDGEAVKLLFTEQKANELGWFADFEKSAKKSNNFEAIIKAERRGKFFKVIE